jgi:hypothetical protein
VPFIILVSDVKRIQSLLTRLGKACERLEVLPRARTELLAADETGLELCLLWLELLESSRRAGELRPFLGAVAESLAAKAVVAFFSSSQDRRVVSGDFDLALGPAAHQEQVSAVLEELCTRRFATNLDHGQIAKVFPSSDLVAFLSVPLLGSGSQVKGLLIATRRQGFSTCCPFNERERLALAVAAAALGLSF